MKSINHQHELETIKQTLSPILAKQGVEKAILFGSWARGTKTKGSDLDLIILAQTEKRFLDRFERFNEIYETFKDRVVDLLIYTPEEFQTIAHRPFFERIMKEGITIYER